MCAAFVAKSSETEMPEAALNSVSSLLSVLLRVFILFMSIKQLKLKEIHLLVPLCLTYIRVLGFVYRMKGHFCSFLVSLKCNMCLHKFFGMYLLTGIRKRFPLSKLLWVLMTKTYNLEKWENVSSK